MFSAPKGGEEINAPVKLESRVAVSFVFPGPADYPRGIIDNLSNLSGYTGGVPHLGTNHATALGAYAFALDHLG